MKLFSLLISRSQRERWRKKKKKFKGCTTFIRLTLPLPLPPSPSPFFPFVRSHSMKKRCCMQISCFSIFHFYTWISELKREFPYLNAKKIIKSLSFHFSFSCSISLLRSLLSFDPSFSSCKIVHTSCELEYCMHFLLFTTKTTTKVLPTTWKANFFSS